MPPAKKPARKAPAKKAPAKKAPEKAPEPVQEAPKEVNKLPFRDDSSERELASSPWRQAAPIDLHSNQVDEHMAKEAARAAQREEHNARVITDYGVVPATKQVGKDGLEVFEDDDIDDDEDGDDELDITKDLPTDDYSKAVPDNDDQPG